MTRDPSLEIGINTTYILELFEKNVQNDPIVSVLALNLLAELLTVDATASATIMQKADNTSFFKLINDVIILTSNHFWKLSNYLAKKGLNRAEEMRKIEGSGYGCPLNAFFDGVFIFLQKYFVIPNLLFDFLVTSTEGKQKNQRIPCMHERQWIE